jgi:hypothetical protein
MPAPQPSADASPLLVAPGWVLWAIVVWLAARCAMGLWRHRTSLGSAWSPHVATASIDVCFVALLLLAGAWAFTDVLAGLARGMAPELPTRLALSAALLAGALVGGWWRGQLGRQRMNGTQVLRCAAGGALMASGSLLIPGSNDGLLLIGLPLLCPYAWAALAVMAATVALALR